MKTASKLVLAGLVVAVTLLVAAPQQAHARRWVYSYPTVVASPVVAAPVYATPVYSSYYYTAPVVYPRRAYRAYYAPTFVPAYPAPTVWYGY